MKDASLLFGDSGTLLSLTLSQKDIVYPFIAIDEKERGGVFWCVPNFDTDGHLFTVRHGEYRKTPSLIFGETHSKTIDGPWGSLATEAVWKRDETTIKTTLFLKAEKDETFIRPGIHPYFCSKNLVKIICGDDTFEPNDIYEPMKIYEPIHTTLDLVYKDYKVRTHLAVHGTQNLYNNLILWTDNPSSYICAEFCMGMKPEHKGGLAKPFTLKKGEETSFEYTISLLKV